MPRSRVAAIQTDVSTTIAIRCDPCAGVRLIALEPDGFQRCLQFVRATSSDYLAQGVYHGVRLGTETERRAGLVQQGIGQDQGRAHIAYAK